MIGSITSHGKVFFFRNISDAFYYPKRYPKVKSSNICKIISRKMEDDLLPLLGIGIVQEDEDDGEKGSI